MDLFCVYWHFCTVYLHLYKIETHLRKLPLILQFIFSNVCLQEIGGILFSKPSWVMKETFPLKVVKQVVKCFITIDCTLPDSKNGISIPLNSKRQDTMKSIFQSSGWPRICIGSWKDWTCRYITSKYAGRANLWTGQTEFARLY